jgi:eukaryotic-like serine/threonine-protein kinase
MYNPRTMPMPAGTKLGPYEIVTLLGAGGMGEVYRARDVRLERTVAVKILPAEFSSDPLLKQRLEREAKTISALNHPHICVLHDVGSQDGIDFIVMECVEGETLAKRLEKGPLLLDQALKYGTQIADALDKAHRSGIVHRDLKPGNIMLTKSGAKLLDFGLAKPLAPDAAALTLMTTPLGAHPLTAEGTILGTFPYMSPEQLQGCEADCRSDIFAFGAVLYEMVTGKRAFDGKTQATIIAAILEREPPPISTLQPVTPKLFDRAVKLCLRKDPDDRWQSAHDLKAELEWVAQADAGASIATTKNRRLWLLWPAAMLLSGAALFVAGYFNRSLPSAQPIRASIPPPPNAAFTTSSSVAGNMAISPDGRSLVFAAEAKGNIQLWVRSLDTLASHPLAGTENAFAPFWSPDSKWIAFFSTNGRLKKVEATGGPVETLCQAQFGRGGTWNQDGLIIFAPNIAQPLFQVAAIGGVPTPVTQLDASRRENTHRWPQFLPDGKHYLFFVRAGLPSATGLYLGTVGSDERQRVLTTSSNALYASPGYLLFGRAETLMAQRFDTRRLRFTGEPAIAAQDVSFVPAPNFLNFSVSQTGLLVYSSGAVDVGRQLVWYDRQGKPLSRLGQPEYSSWPQLSPDGKRLAIRLLTAPAGDFDIWIYDLTRAVHTRMSFSALTAYAPAWSPDGTQLAYAHSTPDAPGDHMYLLNPNGTGKERTLEQPIIESMANYPSSWSPDGRFLLFDRQNKTGKVSIWVLPFSGDRKPYPFVETQFNAQAGKFSPDGHWVAYVSNDSGQDEIYIAPFPGPGSRVQVSSAGGSQPRWRRDGRELFFLSPDIKMMSADLTLTAGDFHVGSVRQLFAVSPLGGVPGYLYDVTADGQKFIIAQDFEHTTTVPLTIVANWPAGLNK